MRDAIPIPRRNKHPSLQRWEDTKRNLDKHTLLKFPQFSTLVVVQLLTHVQLSVTPWTTACQALLFSTISWSLLKFMSIESVMLSNHLILCHRPFPLCFQSFPASGSLPMSQLCIRRPNYWRFSISLSNEYSGLISFRIDWFNLLVVQGTLQGLLQHHNLKASFFRCSAFFMVQLLHPYMITGKTIA